MERGVLSCRRRCGDYFVLELEKKRRKPTTCSIFTNLSRIVLRVEQVTLLLGKFGQVNGCQTGSVAHFVVWQDVSELIGLFEAGKTDAALALLASKEELKAAALHQMVESGRVDVVGFLLLKAGVPPNVALSSSRTPLHIAAQKGDEAIAKLLLEAGAACNQIDTGASERGVLATNSRKSPLHYAAMQGHIGVVRVLLAHGADPNTPDENGNTAQQLAFKYGHVGIASLLPGERPKPAHPRGRDQHPRGRADGGHGRAPRNGDARAMHMPPPPPMGMPLQMPMQGHMHLPPGAMPPGPMPPGAMPPGAMPPGAMPMPGYPWPGPMMPPGMVPVMPDGYMPYPPLGMEYYGEPQYYEGDDPHMYMPYDGYPPQYDPHMAEHPMEVPAMYMPMPMPPAPAPYVDYRRHAPPPPPQAPQISRPDLVKQGNQARYKTELCRAFQDKGVCKYGEKCQFAHGGPELRALPRHPKYKTEMCRTFHSTGICPYGPRCHFIHNSEQEIMSRQRDGPPSVPDTPPPSMMPFAYPSDAFRSASLPPGGYYSPDQFVPVQFEQPEENVPYSSAPAPFAPEPEIAAPVAVAAISPASGSAPAPMSAPAPALLSAPAPVPTLAPASAPPPATSPVPPSKDQSPVRAESASPSQLSDPSSSLVPSTNRARSPPVSVSEAAELLAAASLTSQSVHSISSPGSPHPQSPQRRLAIFTTFKQ